MASPAPARGGGASTSGGGGGGGGDGGGDGAKAIANGGGSPDSGNPTPTSQHHWRKVHRHASSSADADDAHEGRGAHNGYKEARKSGGMKQVISNVMHAAANSHLNILGRRGQGDTGLHDCEPTMVRAGGARARVRAHRRGMPVPRFGNPLGRGGAVLTSLRAGHTIWPARRQPTPEPTTQPAVPSASLDTNPSQVRIRSSTRQFDARFRRIGVSPHGGVAHSWTARPVPVPLPDVLPSRPPQDAITVHFREDGSRRSAPNSPMSVRTKPADAEEASSSSWWSWALPAPSGSNAAYRLPTLAEAIEGVNKAKLGLFASLESLDKADDGDGGRGAH